MSVETPVYHKGSYTLYQPYPKITLGYHRNMGNLWASLECLYNSMDTHPGCNEGKGVMETDEE